MKIIRLDEKNPYAFNLYESLDVLLNFGYEYLPIIFLETVFYEGQELELPKWITKKWFESIDEVTQQFMLDLNSGTI